MSMGGPIYHVRSPRAADCDPGFDDFDHGYQCIGCEKWAKAIQALAAHDHAAERLARLKRRTEFLTERINRRGRSSEANGHDKAEMSALVWVIDLAESVIGTPTKGESNATSNEEEHRD